MTAPRLTLLPAAPHERRAEVTFPADWSVFAGHFPGRPIVPGAELLALAVQLAGRPLRAVERLAFQSSLHPGDTALLVLHLEDARADLTITCPDGRRCATGHLRLAPTK